MPKSMTARMMKRWFLPKQEKSWEDWQENEAGYDCKPRVLTFLDLGLYNKCNIVDTDFCYYIWHMSDGSGGL